MSMANSHSIFKLLPILFVSITLTCEQRLKQPQHRTVLLYGFFVVGNGGLDLISNDSLIHMAEASMETQR